MRRGIKERVYEKTGHKCLLCGKYATTVHHIVRKEFGGLDLEINLMPLCKDCHVEIHAKKNLEKLYVKRLNKKLNTLFLKEKNYTLKELSGILNIEVKELEKYIEKQEIKIVFIDGRVCVAGKEVIRWVMGNVKL